MIVVLVVYSRYTTLTTPCKLIKKQESDVKEKSSDVGRQTCASVALQPK